jgi:hypothetical protein
MNAESNVANRRGEDGGRRSDHRQMGIHWEGPIYRRRVLRRVLTVSGGGIQQQDE